MNFQVKHTTILSKNDKFSNKSKKENILDNNHTNNKNNNWKVLGKPYSQLVFVSVSKIFFIFYLSQLNIVLKYSIIH